jgi:hypothetical protein
LRNVLETAQQQKIESNPERQGQGGRLLPYPIAESEIDYRRGNKDRRKPHGPSAVQNITAGEKNYAAKPWRADLAKEYDTAEKNQRV